MLKREWLLESLSLINENVFLCYVVLYVDIQVYSFGTVLVFAGNWNWGYQNSQGYLNIRNITETICYLILQPFQIVFFSCKFEMFTMDTQYLYYIKKTMMFFTTNNKNLEIKRISAVEAFQNIPSVFRTRFCNNNFKMRINL